MDISDWRSQIDAIDAQLVRLFSERSHCAIEIGKIKRTLNLPVYDPGREKEIIARVIGNNPGPLDDEALKRLFERVLDESRRAERLMAGDHASSPPKQEEEKTK
jgi:chorismate mutase